MNYNKFKNLILDILYPKKCIICNKDGTFLCSNCLQNIKVKTKQKCIVCGKENNCGKLCSKCNRQFYFQYSLTATNFKDVNTKKIIKTFKYKFIIELGEKIGSFLFEFISELQEKELEIKLFFKTKPIIIFIPLHKKRLKWRGFNQAQVIAEYLAKKLNLDIDDNLIRIKNTTTQTNLEKKYRLQNMKNVFSYNGYLNKKNIILIDDVMTTGATMKYASKALRQSGAGNILTLTFAG